VIVYALMSIPLVILSLPIYMYLPSFYAEQFGLSLGAIGLVLFLIRLTDVITDPWVGVQSDRIRLGRTQQMILGSLILSASVWCLMNPAEWMQTLLGLSVLSFITFWAWTWVSVPYQAMLAEVSDSQTRSTWASTREAFSILGVVGLMMAPVLFNVEPTSVEFFEFFSQIFIAMLFSTLFVYWLIFRSIASRPSLNWNYRKLIQEAPETVAIMPSYFLNNLANALPAVLFVMFVSDTLKLKEDMGVLLLTYFFAGLLALPVWLYWAKKVGQMVAWKHSMILASVCFSGVFLLSEGGFWGFWLICVLTGLSLGVDLAIPGAYQANLADRVNRRLNTSISGTLFGVWGLLTKLSMAMAVGIALPVVDFLGVSWVWVMYALLPIMLKLWAVALLGRDRLTQ